MTGPLPYLKVRIRHWEPKCVPAFVSGIVTGERPVNYAIGQRFPLFLVTVPKVFAKGSSSYFPSQQFKMHKGHILPF